MKPRILIAHNQYQQRGGEDQVVDSESALLQKYGHEVILFKEDNASISTIPNYRLAIETIWSNKAKRKISNAIESDAKKINKAGLLGDRAQLPLLIMLTASLLQLFTGMAALKRRAVRGIMFSKTLSP